MLLFIIVGLLSIAPTMRYLAWRRSLRADATYRPPAVDVGRMRRLLWVEAIVFLGIPIAAAAMARGYGV